MKMMLDQTITRGLFSLWFLCAANVCYGLHYFFPLGDIVLRLPGDKRDLPPDGTPLFHLRAVAAPSNNNGSEPLVYNLAGNQAGFRIEAETGVVTFTANDGSKKKNRTVTVEARRTRDNSLVASTRVSIRLGGGGREGEGQSCAELCFWESAQFRAAEHSGAGAVLGDVGPRGLAEGWRACRNRYWVEEDANTSTGSALFGISPSNQLIVMGDLDREPTHNILDDVVAAVNVTLRCQTTTAGTWRKTFEVNIQDVGDHLPRHQFNNVTFYAFLPNNSFRKGDVISTNEKVILYDHDSWHRNNYTLEMDSDFIQASYDQLDVNNQRTLLYITFRFTKDGKLPQNPYSAVLKITDHGLGGQTVNLTLVITLSTPPPPAPTHYRPAEVFRSSAPFARVAQPEKAVCAGAIFSMADSYAFGITAQDGIVYVSNASALLTTPETIHLEVSWRCPDNATGSIDHLRVRMVTESSPFCAEEARGLKKWGVCAQVGEQAKCWRTCGWGTGGSFSVNEIKMGRENRCVWRGTQYGGHLTSTVFSTCTTDNSKCPDAICDPLEALDYRICPQDCTGKVLFEGLLNPETKKGILKGKGVCRCSHDACGCLRTDMNLTNNTTSNNNKTTSFLQAHTGLGTTYCGDQCMLAVAAGSVALLAMATVATVLWCRLGGRGRKSMRGNNGPYVEGEGEGPLRVPSTLQLNFEMAPLVLAVPKYKPDPKWEFPRQRLWVEQTLGEGEFGQVLRAKAFEIAGQPGYTTVAVKTLKEGARDAELADLLSEYEMLKDVCHPNVIRLLGASTSPGGPVYVIIEFAQHGSLRSYLRRCRRLDNALAPSPPSPPSSTSPCQQQNGDDDITSKDILTFAWQISRGMAYLTEMKLVHRDLAARNILVAAGKICKISDFGLTRDVYEDDAYKKRSRGRVPVKWMAPESLADHVYTNKSDVWSFGILLYELVTLGSSPYPGIAVQNLFHLIKSGYRMERPENCSDQLYKIMSNCWAVDPNARPTFRSLTLKWERMLQDGVDYVDFNPKIVQNKTYFGDESNDENEAGGKLQSLWQRPQPVYQNSSDNNRYESPIKAAPVLRYVTMELPAGADAEEI